MQTYTKINTLYERLNITPEIELIPGFQTEWRRFKGLINQYQFVDSTVKYLYNNRFDCFSKIDGTNTKIVFYPSSGKITYGGKTDKADLHLHDTIMPAICERVVNTLKELFPEPKYSPILSEDNTTVLALEEVPVYIYGELYGNRIQACGKQYCDELRFNVFDICAQGWWLPISMLLDYCAKLDLPVVPYLGTKTLKEAIEFVQNGFPTQLNNVNNPDFPEEGLVVRPAIPLFDRHKHRIIYKIKTCDFTKVKAATQTIADQLDYDACCKWFSINAI